MTPNTSDHVVNYKIIVLSEHFLNATRLFCTFVTLQGLNDADMSFVHAAVQHPEEGHCGLKCGDLQDEV